MFVSVVFFITALLGFLTISVLTTQYKSNRKVNIYLLVIFFFISCRFFLSGINTLIRFSINEHLVVIFHSFVCVIFACIYLYFKCLVSNRKNVVVEDLYYFIIPVLFGFTNLFIRKFVPFLHFYVYFLFSGVIFFYFFLSYVELKNKVWFKQSSVLFVDNQKMLIRNWTLFFFSICVLWIIRLLSTLFLDIYVAGYSDGGGYLWVSAILSCILFFKVLIIPEALYVNPVLGNKVMAKEYFELVFEDFWILSNDISVNNNQDLKLKERVENNLMTYVYEIERMALEHFCFRNTSVSMRDFAISLGMPKSHLIYFFKYHSNVNFIEFKRTVRVYDTISLIEEGYLKSNTLDSLSKKTGFSSYGTFLNSFKEITGVAPQEYNKMIREL